MITLLGTLFKGMWGLTKLGFKATKLGLKLGKGIGKGSWKAFLKGRKVGRSAYNVIKKSKTLTLNAMKKKNQHSVVGPKESDVFSKK